ncbi:MAG TPA: hypothetical protein VI452_16155 [Marmoricola sp.]
MRRSLPLLALLLLCAACTTTHAAPHASGHSSPAAGPATTAPRHLQVRQLAWRLPGPLAREAVVRLADRRHVVVAGGLLPGDTSTPATWVLDLRSGRVTRGRPLRVPVHDTAGALVHGRPVVLGGGNAAEQAVVQVRTAHGWRVRGRLPAARSDLAAVTVDGRTLVVGGYDGSSPALGAVLSSTDGVHWKRWGRLPLPVRYPGVATTGGHVWVFGGERNGAEVGAVQRLDLATGRARVVAHLPHPLGHEAAVALGSRILVVGGRTSGSTLTSRMWWFDPATRRFRAAGRLPHRLADSAVVAAHDEAWLVGGETPAFSTRVLRVALTSSAG